MANGEKGVVILAAKGNARPGVSLSLNFAPVQEGTRSALLDRNPRACHGLSRSAGRQARSGEIVVRPSRLHGGV
jgi:hypothetical protein